MEFPFKFGDVDPAMKAASDKVHENLVAEDKDNTDPIVAVRVRINGKVHHHLTLPIPKDYRPADGTLNYKTVKEAARQVIGFYHSKLKVEGVGVHKLDIDSLTTDPQWDAISKDHIAQENSKFPPDTHKFDFDASVYVNGKLWFHGWQVVGFNQSSVDFATMVAVVQGLLDSMNDTEDPVQI